MKLGEKYKEEHEKITDIEMEMIETVPKEDYMKLFKKAEKLKSIYENHIIFEEKELFPLAKDEVPKKILEKLEKEHEKTEELVKEIDELVSENAAPIVLMKKLSKLRGIHSGHIHLENEYFYPILIDLNPEEAKEIIKNFEE